MNFSNCNELLGFQVSKPQLIVLQNGEVVLGKCISPFNEMNNLCTNSSDNANSGQQNWTREMICNWSTLYENVGQMSLNSIDRDIGSPAEDLDETSIKLLFSNNKALNEDSPKQSDPILMALNQREAVEFFRNYPSEYENIFLSNNQSDKSLDAEEEKPTLAVKDTRQNLVDQKRNEIREKIKEEISSVFKNDPRSLIRPEEYIFIKETKTIGVSTESTPRLNKQEQPSELSREKMINVVSFEQQTPTENKNIPSLELCQEVERKEESHFSKNVLLDQTKAAVCESSETPANAEDKYFFEKLCQKLSEMPITKVKQVIYSICDKELNKKTTEKRNEPSDHLTRFPFITNSSRAVYCPPKSNQTALKPNSQFQLIVNNVNRETKIVDASALNISRSPVICPISSCRRAFFVSDFTRHIAVDHTKVPMERVFPNNFKNFFLDPKLIHCGVSRCQILLLVKDKIRNLGHEKFKDFIPVLLMTTKVTSMELCCDKPEKQNNDTANNITQSFVMIWLTGIIPPEVPIFFSLTVWARSGNMPSCHIVHSGQLYSVRNSQSPKDVQESGQMLLLSKNQIELLTNKGRNMLELQIEVH